MCVKVTAVHLLWFLLFLFHLLDWAVFDEVRDRILCAKLFCRTDFSGLLSWLIVGPSWSAYLWLCLHPPAQLLLRLKVHNHLCLLSWISFIILRIALLFCVISLHDKRLILVLVKYSILDQKFHMVSAKLQKSFKQVNDHESVVWSNDGFYCAQVDSVRLVVEKIHK